MIDECQIGNNDSFDEEMDRQDSQHRHGGLSMSLIRFREGRYRG